METLYQPPKNPLYFFKLVHEIKKAGKYWFAQDSQQIWLERHEDNKGLELKHDLVTGFPHRTKAMPPKHISHGFPGQLFRLNNVLGAPGSWDEWRLKSSPHCSYQIINPSIQQGLPRRKRASYFFSFFFFK